MTSILEVEQLDTLSSNASSTLTIGGTNTTTIAFGPNVTTTPSSLANTPSFFAYQSSVQSIPNTTQTTVQYNVVLYDSNSCYSTSTYRFTPTVAGKYYVGMTMRYDNVNSSRCIGYIYKNTNIYTLDEMWSDSGSGPDLSPKNYAIVDMNGTTDYVEAKTYHDKGFAVNSNPVNQAINFFGYKIIGA